MNNFRRLSSQQQQRLTDDPVLFSGVDAALRMASQTPGRIGDTHIWITDRIARGCALLLLDSCDRPFATVTWSNRPGIGVILTVVAPFGDRARIFEAVRQHLEPSEPGFVFCPESATELQQVW